MLDYLVLYQSRTGNTRKIAATIFSALPGKSKDIIELSEDRKIPEARVYFIGFGIYQGACHLEITDFLNDLGGKQIALFATCGMGDNERYCQNISDTVSAWIEDDNEYLGAFICQGKMPLAFRQKCERLADTKDKPEYRKMLQSFDQALTHPDELDVEHAKVFVSKILRQLDTLNDEPL